MKHYVSATTFDPVGHIEVNAIDGQDAGPTSRRVNRIATLDGGAAFNDFGVSDADRTIELRWKTTERATGEGVDRLLRLYQRVHVSTPAGFFLAAPETYTPGVAESRLRLLVVERLSE